MAKRRLVKWHYFYAVRLDPNVPSSTFLGKGAGFFKFCGSFYLASRIGQSVLFETDRKSEPCPQKLLSLTIFFCACAERSFTSLVSAFQFYLHHASQCCRRFGDLLFCVPGWRSLCAGRGCGVCRIFYDCSCETYFYCQSLQLKVLGASHSSFNASSCPLIAC
jgi:hypothetical protein